VIRKRLPLEVHLQVFAKILEIAKAHGLVRGKRVVIDATTMDASAAMNSIARRATGKD
jgi:transposase